MLIGAERRRWRLGTSVDGNLFFFDRRRVDRPEPPIEQELPFSWQALVDDPSLWTSHLVPQLSSRPGFWECAPVSRLTRDDRLRFVCIDSDAVARIDASPRAFNAYFQHPGGVAAFRNLGGDSRLVAPATPGSFPHLRAFLDTAPQAQISALFRCVSAELEAWWARTDELVWLSTHGLGVPWLHVRLDARPKYYRHRPYQRGR